MLPRVVPLKDGRSVTLRQGRVADAVQLLEFVNAVAAEGRYFLSERLNPPMSEEHKWIRTHDGSSSGLLIVVEAPGGAVVGNLSATRVKYPKGSHRAFVGLGLLPAYRGEGIGRALLEEAREWARRKGVRKLTLEVFSSNRRAIALYRSFGFVDDGVNKRHHKIKGRYVDNIHMAMWL